MSKRTINIITYIVTFGLCAFLVWYSVHDLQQADIDKIKFAVSKANYLLLVPIVIMGLLSHWSRAVRWRMLMQPLDMNPTITNTFLSVMIGYLANLFLPRLGEFIKCTMLSRYEKIPADKLIGTIITERAFDMLCLVIIFFITFLLQIDLANDYVHSLLARMQSGSGEGSSTKYIVLSVLILIVGLFFIFRKALGRLAFLQKIKSIFSNIISGIMSFRFMKNKAGFVFHTFLIWGCYLTMIYLGFKSIQETNMLGWNTSFSVLSFGSLGMIATPGGIGAYTLLVDEIVRLYGVEKAISVAISWIIWLVPTIIILIGGIASLLFIPIFNRHRHVK